MTYFPDTDSSWSMIAPEEVGLNPENLNAAVDFAREHETSWPMEIQRAGAIPSLTEIEKPPFNSILGPIEPRGKGNGIVLKEGKIVAKWGDIARPDMTFSIAKSYLSILTGIAISDGLIKDVDDLIRYSVPGNLFASDQNRNITWRHLLHQTSEWEGTLFEKPDLIDRNRQVGPGADNTRKGTFRDLRPPGSYWEYNDVRVNLLSLCLLHIFKAPLPEILKLRIMDPIGASNTWTWYGYDNSFVEIDGHRLQSVPGGTHWGGGIHINTLDQARFGLMVHHSGAWKEHRLIPSKWFDALRTPCPIRPEYGYLWWLNTDRGEWPEAEDNSYGAVGAGTNIIWISPQDNIVVVARWIDQRAVSTFLGLLTRAVNQKSFV